MYLHTLTDEEVIMLLKGPLEELMVVLNPTLYRKYVVHDSKGVPIVYVKMNILLYGLFKSALPFYNKLRG